MHQTIYIDVDEEITSILDRVRQESTMNIFLVVPKGAMLLDSIINLKLLKKESEKMGKVVSIVAPNDDRAKTMIERAGIKAEDYNQTMNEQQLQAASTEGTVGVNQINKVVTETVGEAEEQIIQGSLDVGSNSFFAKNNQHKNINTVTQNQQESNQAHITSDSQKLLNSQVQSVQPVAQQNVTKEQEHASNAQFAAIDNNYQKQNEKSGVNSEFLQDNKFNYFKEKQSSVENTSIKKSSRKSFFGNKFLIIIIGLVIIALIGGGGWCIVNYPKLTLAIKPLSEKVDKEMKIVAKSGIDSVDIENKIIPGEYMEIPLEKTIEFDATGSKVVDKNGAKARGTVTIENTLSDKPQRLVKTTRILSKDGKLFRLSKDIMVPGMKGDEPGKIDVTVEADKPGKDFNIDKSEFVIVAWKGTPKGDKFKVYSNNAMAGGITSADSKTRKVVSKKDLDMARKETLRALDESLEDEIKKRLNPGQKVVQSSIEKEIVSNKASHLVDTTADKFSYTVVYKIKVMAFMEDDVRKVVEGIIKNKLGIHYQLESDFAIETKRGVVDLDKKTITIYVDVMGISWFKINEDKIKESIAGKNSEEVAKVLNRDLGIESAEMIPSPSWSSKVPTNLDKITIEIIK